MKKRIWGQFCDTSGESHKADQSPLILTDPAGAMTFFPIRYHTVRVGARPKVTGTCLNSALSLLTSAIFKKIIDNDRSPAPNKAAVAQ